MVTFPPWVLIAVSLLTATWQVSSLRHPQYPGCGAECFSSVTQTSYLMRLPRVRAACVVWLLTSSLWPTYLPTLSPSLAL